LTSWLNKHFVAYVLCASILCNASKLPLPNFHAKHVPRFVAARTKDASLATTNERIAVLPSGT
jgi:hypothetical protein